MVAARAVFGEPPCDRPFTDVTLPAATIIGPAFENDPLSETLGSSLVSEASRGRAAGMAWEDYYKAVEGRSLRPLFVAAIPFLPDPLAAERARVAVDLGCGDGRESLALLTRGWSVVAVDVTPEAVVLLQRSVPPDAAPRLTTVVGAFHEVVLPEADFVYAGLSLPFCSPEHFADVWRAVRGALARKGAVFAGHFFGPNDSWASTSDMTFHTRKETEALFAGYEVQSFTEQDEDGASAAGPKHWHVFHVIATKRSD
jgi:SAM-dependent methyltransferase